MSIRRPTLGRRAAIVKISSHPACLIMSKQLGLRRLGSFVSTSLLAAALIMASTGSIAHAEGDSPILSDSHLGSAVQVQIDPRCSESRFRKSEVTVSWAVDDAAATDGSAPKSFVDAEDVRLDITSAPGGLEIGRFTSVMVSSGEAPPANKSFTVDSDATTVRFLDLSPGVIYHVRVLVLTESGWVPSAPTRFLTPVCAVDGLDGDEGGGR